jgi:hypothetical protein
MFGKLMGWLIILLSAGVVVWAILGIYEWSLRRWAM